MLAKRLKIWAPVLFWMILLGVNLVRVFPFLQEGQFQKHLITISITFPLDFITFALFYFWLVPNVMAKKHVTLMLVITGMFWVCYGLIYDLMYFAVGRIDSLEGAIVIYKSSLGHTILHTLYAVVLRFAVDWISKYQREKELEHQNTLSELAVLRSQLNPHFLFNVLNNVHSFVYTDPDKTSHSLIKLSDLMRYMLYETNEPEVELENEIKYIEDYLSLQKLRLQDSKNVKFEVIGNTSNVKVAPLIFISFIENAFKHGKKNIPEGIIIRLKIEHQVLEFHCSNFIRQLTDSEVENVPSIGLENIRKRLKLIYGDSHQLRIKNDGEKHIVDLRIELNK